MITREWEKEIQKQREMPLKQWNEYCSLWILLQKHLCGTGERHVAVRVRTGDGMFRQLHVAANQTAKANVFLKIYTILSFRVQNWCSQNISK